MITWSTYVASLAGFIAEARAIAREPHYDGSLELAALVGAPPGGTPEPADVERARALLDELEELVRELEVAQSRVGRQLQLHRRLAAGRAQAAGPVYVDSFG